MENDSVIFRGTFSIDIRLTHQALNEQSPVNDKVAGLIPPWCCGWLGAPGILSLSHMGKQTAQLYCWDLISGRSTTTPR